MIAFTEILLVMLLLTDLSLAVSSRLLHCIRLVAFQGLFIALFPLANWDWSKGAPHAQILLIALVTLAVKAILLPKMLRHSMYKAHVRRELEPFVGHSLSLFIILIVAACAFIFCQKRLIFPDEISILCVPTALTTLFTGLFVIISRRKAITQAIGFLVFENGITIFGLGMMLEYSIVVELGILLDVFVLVFVMGIAIFQINREFAHINAEELRLLSDDTPEGGAE